jgi:hypothetical protein
MMSVVAVYNMALLTLLLKGILADNGQQNFVKVGHSFWKLESILILKMAAAVILDFLKLDFFSFSACRTSSREIINT